MITLPLIVFQILSCLFIVSMIYAPFLACFEFRKDSFATKFMICIIYIVFYLAFALLFSLHVIKIS